MEEHNFEFADEVYIVLNKDYRISRHFRLKWFLDHLLKSVPAICENLNDNNINNDEGLHVVSISSKHGDHKCTTKTLAVGTDTKVIYLSTAYRFVFGLDLSSSMLRVDTLQHFVVIEALIIALEKCLTALIQPFFVNGDLKLTPDIYVTIFVQWYETKDCNYDTTTQIEKLFQKVILQGCKLTKKTVNKIVQDVKNCIYRCKYLHNQANMKPNLRKCDDIILGMLRTGLLALRALPANRQSSLIIITGGILGEPHAPSLETIIKQCQSTTTSCFFLHACFSANPLCDFGCIPNVELMHFISKSTNGKYINMLHVPTASLLSLTIFQQALFPWSFQVLQPISIDPNNLSHYSSTNSCSAFELRNALPVALDSPSLIKRKQDDRTILSDFVTIVSARLREGFKVLSTTLSRGKIHMLLELSWWKNYTIVQYNVSSSWPLTSISCKVEVYISGTYEFLHDVSKWHESKHWSRSRRQVVHRFLTFFQDLIQSDHMLQNLQSFTDDPVRYHISDSLRQGQTLFYIPPNSSQFELSTQSQDTSPSFSSFWKPILSLDISIWHRWLHIHKIEAILQHDMPLPNNLFTVSNNGRYHSVQCRVAFTTVASMLRKWCTFVLLENHTYVKLVFNDGGENAPISFFLVRILCKSSAMVIKVAFLLGLSGKVRRQYVESLRKQLFELVFSVPTVQTRTSSNRSRHSSVKHSPVGKLSRSQYSTSDIPCAFLLHRPLDQFLVRYSQAPEDYMSTTYTNQIKLRPSNEINDHCIRMRDIQWYLHHYRCVWSVTNTTSTQLSIELASHLTNMLQNIRMKEGFHITYANSGMVNLTREFPLKSDNSANDYCLVQYIIFPPKILSDNLQSSSSVDFEDEETDEELIHHKEILFATEIWVEPQYGSVCQGLYNSENANYVPHYENLASNDLLLHISSRDFACISNMVTLEHLHLMCHGNDEILDNSSFPQPYKSSRSVSPNVELSPCNSSPDSEGQQKQSDLKSNISENNVSDKDVFYYSCLFDFVTLLENSPRVKHLYMTLAEDDSNNHTANIKLVETFHIFLSSFCDCVVNLSEPDQISLTRYFFPTKTQEYLNPSQQLPLNCSFWNCYLKKGDDGQVFVIILPSSYPNFLKLLDMFEDQNPTISGNIGIKRVDLSTPIHAGDVSTFNENETSSLAKESRRMSFKRLASNTSDTPQSSSPSNVKQHTFYLYIYNCSRKMLNSTLLHGALSSENIKWANSLQDHRIPIYFGESESNHILNKKNDSSFSPLSSSSFELYDITESAFPLQSNEKDYLSFITDSVNKLYDHAFVVGIFCAVQSNCPYFSIDDLQIATDYICKESVHEIDITNFMFLNCPQIIEFKSNNLKPSIPSSVNTQIDDIQSGNSDVEEVSSYKCEKHYKKRKVVSNIHENSSESDDNPIAVEENRMNSDHGSCLNSISDSNILGEANKLNDSHSVVSSIFHKESAFSSVDSNYHTTAIKNQLFGNNSGSASFDDEVCAITNTSLPAFTKRAIPIKSAMLASSLDNETNTTTPLPSSVLPKKVVPIKPMVSCIHQYSGLQTGWSNLPKFSIDFLNVSHSRHLSGSNEQVEKHFIHLLKAFCQSVPGVPFLFCSVNRSYHPKKTLTYNGSQFFDNELEVEFTCDNENENDSFSAMPTDSNVLIDTDTKVPTCTVENESLKSYDSTDSTENVTPLFLYMTCTVCDLQTGNRGSVPVKCLPLSLKDVFDSFDKPCNSVDLSQIKITLDLIWIYLPSAASENTVATVPVECDAFVQGVTRKVKWLLEDEIVSSIRTTEPINTATLNRVATHVKSRKTSNSKVTPVPLQLIFGVERSNSLLRSEFEKFRIDNYKLKKVDNYYFLSLERTFLPITSGGIVEDDGDLFFSENHPFKLITSPNSLQLKNTEKNQSVQLKLKPLLSSQSNSASLSSANGIEKGVIPSRFIKKASSSNELVLSGNSAVRRCTSATNMPLNTAVSFNNMETPPPRYHQSLQPSLSLGKETKFYSPVNSAKGHVLSVPVTPSSAANIESDIFIFPLSKNETKPALTFGDSCISPTSECSIRQFSQTSWVGSGYEGEESDVGEELDFRNSLQEACNQLPNFWLFVSFDDATANIYFHRRSSTKVLSFVKKEHLRIFELLSSNLKKSCRAVNQTLLLKMLHDTRLCHSLLVEESPENIWKKDDYSSIYPHIDSVEDQTSDDVYRSSTSNDYLAATMDFPPGYFECTCILEQTIFLHHRIAVSKCNVGGTVLTALSSVRSVMKNLTIINHKNMFVFQVEDGTVYYCIVHEEIKRPESSGRKSSSLQVDSDTSWSSREILVKQQENQSKLILKWYGVHDPLPHHCEDLTKLRDGIEKKLNDTVIEYVTLMLCRNSQFKLTPADVCLIQPRVLNSCGHSYSQTPDHTIIISLPYKLNIQVTALLYYIHQHFLLFLAIPRYTDPGFCQFLPFHSIKNTNNTAATSLDSPALYLYTELKEKGKKGHGIACVCLDYLQSKKDTSFEHMGKDKKITLELLKEFTDITIKDNCGDVTEAALAIHVWVQGSLNIAFLQGKIQTSVKHALCDAVTEHCLEMPFVPPMQVKTAAMKPLFNDRDDSGSSFYQNLIQSKLGGGSMRIPEILSKQIPDNRYVNEGALLNTFFANIMQQWLVYNISICSPLVIHKSIECSKKINIYQLVNNICKIASSVFIDSDVLKFSKIANSTDPFTYTSSNDISQSNPGQFVDFVVLSRNFELWNRTTNRSTAFKVSSVTNSLQKFPPHDVNLKPDASPCPQHSMMMSSAFIPRQHFLLLLISSGSITVFTYNVVHDKVQTLTNQLEECTKFHHARLIMLQGLTMQKLGLFRHFMLKQPSSNNASVAPYSIDFLTRYCKVPNQDKKQQRFTVIDKCFDEALLNIPRVDNTSIALETKDLTTLYGHQCFSWWKQIKSLKEGQAQLKTLWRKTSGSSFAVSSDSIKTVLSFARLLYSVTSPILLDKTTRYSFVSLFDPNLKNARTDSKSVGILRTSSFLGSYKRKSGESMLKMVGDRSNPLLKDDGDDFYRHSLNFISNKFIELYDDHWKSFVELDVNDLIQNDDKKQALGLSKDSIVRYRYRSLREGIILIEYFASENCFQVKLYSISASHFLDHISRSHSRAHTSFTSDCEKIKQNLNLHSVSLDVHLRYLQWYLKNSSYFNKFNLYDLLLSITTCYGSLLENIQSQVYRNILNIPCAQVNCRDLFDFLVDNATALKLRTCCMLNESTGVSENILFTDENVNLYVNNCSAKAHRNCCVFLIIFKIDDSESNVLKLHYYLLLSHLREHTYLPTSFNKRLPDALAQAGANISRRLSVAAGQPVLSTAKQQAVLKQHCSDLDDIPVPSYVNCEKNCVEKSLHELVCTATTECYRGRYLWKKLSNICQEKASGKTLSYSEFCSLLDMMQSASTIEYDQKLAKLFQRRIPFKQDQLVQKRLLRKFPKLSTLIISPDGLTQHVCILTSEDVHVMLMLTTKSDSPSMNVTIVKPLTEHNVFHKDSSESACKKLVSKVYQTLTTTIWMSWL